MQKETDIAKDSRSIQPKQIAKLPITPAHSAPLPHFFLQSPSTQLIVQNYVE
jgi:hypothetical protein